MQIEFIASFAPITADPAASRRLYVEGLGLPLEQEEGGDYLRSEAIDGSRHFGVWPLRQAAQSCFGSPDWPDEVPVPQASVEFELGSAEAVQAAVVELRDAGHQILHEAKVEPWGQTVARLLSPEHLVVGLSFAPWMHP